MPCYYPPYADTAKTRRIGLSFLGKSYAELSLYFQFIQNRFAVVMNINLAEVIGHTNMSDMLDQRSPHDDSNFQFRVWIQALPGDLMFHASELIFPSVTDPDRHGSNLYFSICLLNSLINALNVLISSSAKIMVLVTSKVCCFSLGMSCGEAWIVHSNHASSFDPAWQSSVGIDSALIMVKR